MKYFFLAFKKWNDINGRANLKEFWYYTLFYFLFYFLFFFIDDMFINDFFLSTGEFVTDDFAEGGILTGLYALINIIPSLTCAVRRMHDSNKSGWNLLWALTIIGVLYIWLLYILKGTNGDNYYGSPSTA